MNKSILAVFALSLAISATAQAQARLSEEQLIEIAIAEQTCGEDSIPTSARYVNDTENRVTVTCGDAEGFVPLVAAGLGLGGASAAAAAAAVGLAAAAAAAGGGGSTPDTQ